MGRSLGDVTFFGIQANLSPCAHICRYCCIGDRHKKFPIDRWLAFSERFVDWFDERGLRNIRVSTGFFPSYNFDIATYKTLKEWYLRKFGTDWVGIALGGLPKRSAEEMRAWLAERRNLGFSRVISTFVGHGAVHDRWNGRRGDFDFLMRTVRTAAELGYDHADHHLLVKSSLPLLLETFARLDAVPTPPTQRTVGPILNAGHGAHHDSERIAEDDRDILPEAIARFILPGHVLRSEREWIELLRSTPERPREIQLHIELTTANIDRLEATSCEAIFSDLEGRARSSLGSFPNLAELAERYGDRNGIKIYMTLQDMESTWLQRHVDANRMTLDRDLLHLHLSRSVRPPRLWSIT